MTLKLKAAPKQYKSQSVLVPDQPTHTRHRSIQLNLNLSDSDDKLPKTDIIHEENENVSVEIKVEDEFPQTSVLPLKTHSSTSKNFIYKNISNLQKQSSEVSERRLPSA
jgi:hypothetical protein